MTDQHRLSSSLRFLAAASFALSSSFDYVGALADVADLFVPAFADGVTVQLDDESAQSIPLVRGRVPAFGDSPAGAVPALGGSSLFADFPLAARGRTLGTLRVARDADAAPIDHIDRELFADIAVRIAVAVDSALIYAREHHVADSLQRALLPESLPRSERQRFDAAYLPGAEESIVGGDWYDAFALPDGRIAISIGDVAGHGLRAAIVMGEVRQAFRAAALNPNSPSLVLERANTIVNMRVNPVMVTAIFGIIDPGTNTFTYAAAGHPPPVLGMACGSVHQLPAGGIPLGIADAVDAVDWTFTLPTGSLLALYTDGLIEYSHDVLDGEKKLLEVVAAEMVDPRATPARSLLERVFGTGIKNTDDVAALVVASADDVTRDFHFAFSAIPLAVPMVRRALARHLSRIGLDDERTFALLTAVGEALANGVEHAYPEAPGVVRVHVAMTDAALVTTVEDDGRWKPAQKRDERGRGLPLMRALMDGVEIRTHQQHTIVRLTLMHAGTKTA